MTLKEAKEIYFYPNRVKRKNVLTIKRTITKRGVVWLGQTCNIKCYFCFFIDKINDKSHIEHPFMNIEKAKKIVHTLRYTYGNKFVDIQGGEPTIYPHIFELIEYCNEIGIKPTLITNGLILSKESIALKFKKVGINDFLFSIHGFGESYDKIAGVKGASKKQMKALYNLQKFDIPFRINFVMTKENMHQMIDMTQLAIETGAKVVVYQAFTPFADQNGQRDVRGVPRYSELKESLQKAIDILEKNDIEVNVRYFPLCILDENYRKNIYNFQQLPYDHREWDYNSWTWTTRLNQKSNTDILDKPIPILMYNLNKYNGIDFSDFSKHGTKTHYYANLNDYEMCEFMLKLHSANIPKELLYKNNAKLRAQKHTGYKQSKVCKKCDIQDICDGFHGDYADVFGMDEANAISLDICPIDSTFYIKNQKKILE